jgi:hypothetical protein
MKLLFELIGSPFSNAPLRRLSDQELLSLYDSAFENRVALLLLSLHRREGWHPELEKKYCALKAREQATLDVIARLGSILNQICPDRYTVFKSVKPYPATPNDTDVICFGGQKDYEEIYRGLIEAGYVFHEWAPQQRTVYDCRGAGKIGKGKKGGTYYIDLYAEISTDYFSYLNKHRLRSHVIAREVMGIPVKMLRPEPELAIVMFHSLFPERTFQLEHFYVPMYVLARADFDHDLFIAFCRESGTEYAVRSHAGILASIHQKNFGFVPKSVRNILERLGHNGRELANFDLKGGRMPYMFTPRTFWSAFARKATEWYCFRSLVVQMFKMLNPKFSLDVLRSIRLRMSEQGTYHLE